MGPYEFCADVEVDPEDTDVGAVEVGMESAPVTVTVSNLGQAPLTVGTVTLSGPAAGDFEIRNDGVSGKSIPAGGSETFDVVFKPGSTGTKEASADVPSDDPDTPTLSSTFLGVATMAPIHPKMGVIGTVVTLEAESGFGTKKPKVWLAYTDPKKGKTKKKSLKVQTYSDTMVTCYMSAKLPDGRYELYIQPKGGEPHYLGAFDIASPEAGTLSANTAAPGATIDVTGKHFGDKKAKPTVYFVYNDPKKGKEKKKKCKVVKNSLTFDPATGDSALKIVVPKVPDVTGVLRLTNRHSSVILSGDFVVASGG
jgi:hypothetical protein